MKNKCNEEEFCLFPNRKVKILFLFYRCLALPKVFLLSEVGLSPSSILQDLLKRRVTVQKECTIYSLLGIKSTDLRRVARKLLSLDISDAAIYIVAVG